MSAALSSLADQLLPLLLGNALVATALAALAWLAQLARRPTLVHGFCALALLKLLTPPLWQIEVLPAADAPVALETLDHARTAPELPIAPALAVPALGASAPCQLAAAPEIAWSQLGLALAAAGTLACLLASIHRARRFRTLMRAAEPAAPDLAARLRRLAAHMGVGRPPQLRLVAARISPMLCVLHGTATVVLPRALVGSASPEQVDTLLAHELAHLRRRDHWLRAVELAAFACYWWLPTIWWLRRALRRAEEQCVDAQVLQRLPEHSRSYADALLATLDFLAGRHAMPPIACGAGPFHDLRTRLTTIMTNSPDQPLSRLARLAFLTLAGVALPLAPGMAQDEVRAPDNQREAKLRAQVDAAAKEVAALRDELQALRAELQANRGQAAAAPRTEASNQGILHRAFGPDSTAETREGLERAVAQAREVAKALDTVRPHLRAAQADGAAAKEHLAKIKDEVKAATKKAVDFAHAHAGEGAEHAERAHQALAQAHDAVRQAHEQAAQAKARAELEAAHAKITHDFSLGATRADAAPRRADAARTHRDAVVEKLRAESLKAATRDDAGDRDAEIEALRRQMQAMQRKLEALQRATEARSRNESRGAASSGGR